MPSFDVVCKTDLAELDNAINGVGREVGQRFDLKGTDCSVERSGNSLIINADNDMLLRQMHDLIRTYCGKRGVDSKVLYFNKPQEEASKIMLEVHKKGSGICGVFTYEIAETKIYKVLDISRKNGHPLHCIIEEV